jgi:hypothetical protein
MRIITSNNKRILQIDQNDWKNIIQSGSIVQLAKNSKKKQLLDQEKKHAFEFANKIRKSLRANGHEVSKIKELRGNKIGIQLVDGYRVGIEIKPWASQNNKKLQWRSGIMVIVGSGVDKYFKRRRIGKNIEKICSYIEKIINFYNKKEEMRLKRQEISDKKREEKVEQAKLEQKIKKQTKEAQQSAKQKCIVRSRFWNTDITF